MAEVPSGFELQAAMVEAARASGRPVRNAGRGEPNWLSTAPRAAAHQLGLFAVDEASAASSEPLWGRAPAPGGVAARLRARTEGATDVGFALLGEAVDYGTEVLGFEADAWVHELVLASLGCGYPTPTRSLVHLEQVLQRYLVESMCAGSPPPGRFEVFATEGGAAAMTYVFRSLKESNLIGPGDHIAIATPIFTPYLQIPTLRAFGFEVTELAAQHGTPERFGDELFEGLLDPRIKAFFMVNPGNPDARALPPDRLHRFKALVTEQRPDLVIVTDTVYATFIEGFRSLVAEIPRNVICVHSFSKHFGATGARLGFIAVHEDSVIDELLAAHPDDVHAAHGERYRSLTSDVRSLGFMRRLVADSRAVALHNIAGLATPDQAQMGLFALTFLVPSGRAYFERTRSELHGRLQALLEPLGLPEFGGADSFYYGMVDLLDVAQRRHGAAFAERLQASTTPGEVLLRLAGEHGVVVLPGSSFGAAGWDVRVSLASLDGADQRVVGEAIGTVLDDLARST